MKSPSFSFNHKMLGGKLHLSCDATLANIGVLITAVHLFLRDDRFTDFRSVIDIERGAPLSLNNCIPASIFLAEILSAYDLDGRWVVHTGYCRDEWHVFAVDEFRQLVADVTADQFGLAEAMLCSIDEAKEHKLEGLLLEASCNEGQENMDVQLWHREWLEHSERYLTAAYEMISSGVIVRAR